MDAAFENTIHEMKEIVKDDAESKRGVAFLLGVKSDILQRARDTGKVDYADWQNAMGDAKRVLNKLSGNDFSKMTALFKTLGAEFRDLARHG